MAANAARTVYWLRDHGVDFRQAQHRCINSWLCRIDQCSRAWIGRIMAPDEMLKASHGASKPPAESLFKKPKRSISS